MTGNQVEKNVEVAASSRAIDKEIVDFIGNNNIATVCCVVNNMPHCFNCFYSVLEGEPYIIFKSSEGSKHMQILTENNQVAGTIISSEISLSKVQGMQFDGVIVDKDSSKLKAAKSYYLRYPFAVAMAGKLQILEFHSIKYTNTTNGIKRKKEWEQVK